MGHPKGHHSPPVFGGRSHHSDPWREGRHSVDESQVGTLTTGGLRTRRANSGSARIPARGQELRPLLHQDAPAPEQVRAGIGRFYLVADHV